MDVVEQILGEITWATVIGSSLRILFILLLAWIGVMVIKHALRRLERHLVRQGVVEGQPASESAKRAETLVRLLRQAVVIMVWVTASLVVLREVGVEIAPILASAGVAGLAIGFGAQNLVRDVIAGFFIILENQVRVGDVAVINGTGGLVEEVNFRTLVLRDLSGTVHIFPNGTIGSMANMTTGWSGYVMDIGVAYKEDTDHVVEVMRQVAEEMRKDEEWGPSILQEMEVFGVDDFADSAVVIKARLKTLPIQQWAVGREYRRRLKKAFDAAGIEIPFPHRSIYFGEASKPIIAELIERSGHVVESGTERSKV
ncbi:mechanosensitive ion channel family protein [Ectothiorhodospiraceae bacterium 2226]|nr:mechanosensitive ion channel family protein [Ectothiorhodospiraceae bacterium 2226]